MLPHEPTTTVAGAARKLGITRVAVFLLLQRERIRATKFHGRWIIPVSEVDRWQEKRAAERNRKGEPRSVKRHAKEPATTPTDSD